MSSSRIKLTRSADNGRWETSDVRGEREDQYQSRKRPRPKSSKNKLRTGRQQRIPHRRQESCSPEMEETSSSSSSGGQSSDRRRKSYRPSSKLKKNDNDFIWLVSRYPNIWDRANPLFNDKKMRWKVWTTIANVFGMDANKCYVHWKRLRIKYDREVKKLTELIPLSFRLRMNTELIFMESRGQNVRIVEDSHSNERWDSIRKKSQDPTAVTSCFQLSKFIQEQSGARSSVSGHSQDPSPGITTSTTQMSTPGSIRPSTSSFNPGLPATASPPFLQTRASTSSDTRSSVFQPPRDPSPIRTTSTTQMSVLGSIRPSTSSFNPGLPATASPPFLQTRASTSSDTRSFVFQPPGDPAPGTTTSLIPMVVVPYGVLSSLPNWDQGSPDTASPVLPQARALTQSDTQSSVLQHPQDPSPRVMPSTTLILTRSLVPDSNASVNQGSPDTASSAFSQAGGSTALNTYRIIREPVPDCEREHDESLPNIYPSGGGEDYYTLNASAEMTFDEQRTNPSPLSDVKPACEQIISEEEASRQLMDLFAGCYKKIQRKVKHDIVSQMCRLKPSLSQEPGWADVFFESD